MIILNNLPNLILGVLLLLMIKQLKTHRAKIERSYLNSCVQRFRGVIYLEDDRCG